jgi:uncharacterized protein (TIGR00730 family)
MITERSGAASPGPQRSVASGGMAAPQGAVERAASTERSGAASPGPQRSVASGGKAAPLGAVERAASRASIGVFCGSARDLPERWLSLAAELGRELGKRGHSLVSGGGCVGMMGAVADGARSVGAHTFGVMPASLVALEIADRAADELVITDDMFQRKTIMLDKADAFITLPGGLGTLDELFEVWTTATLAAHAKPVVLLDADGFYAGLLEWLAGLVPAGFVRREALELLTVVPDVPAAVAAVERGLGWTR